MFGTTNNSNTSFSFNNPSTSGSSGLLSQPLSTASNTTSNMFNSSFQMPQQQPQSSFAISVQQQPQSSFATSLQQQPQSSFATSLQSQPQSSFATSLQSQQQPNFTTSFQPQQQQPSIGKIAKTIEKLQLSYAPYQDNQGKPITSIPSTLQQQVGIMNQNITYKSNDDCQFQKVLYDKRCMNMQQLMADSTLTGSLLEKAEINNPDPLNYYPVIITGIDALKSRFDQQQIDSQKLKEQSRTIVEVIQKIGQSNIDLNSRFNSLKVKQIHLFQQLLTLLRKIEVLRCRSLPLEQSEARYREKLQHLYKIVQGPYLELQDMCNNMRSNDPAPFKDIYSSNYTEADLEALCDALRRQREGLEHVTEILNKDIRDISIVRSLLNAPVIKK